MHKDNGCYTIDSVMSVFSSGFFWLIIENLLHIKYGFLLFTFTLAIHLQIIILLRIKAVKNTTAKPNTIFLVSIISSALLISNALIYYGLEHNIVITVIFATIGMFIGGIIVTVKSNRFSRRRWLSQACISILGSSSALIPLTILGSI